MKKNKFVYLLIIIFILFTSIFYHTAYANKITTNANPNYLYLIEVNNKYGYINKQGKEIVSPKYDSAGEFSEGIAPVCKKNKCGYINTNGEIVIPFKFDSAQKFSEEMAMVCQSYKCGFIDLKGNIKILVSDKFDDALPFKKGVSIVEKNKKYGLINKKGQIILPLKFNKLYSFSNDLCRINLKNKYGYLNNKAEIVVQPKYDYGDNFSDGLAFIEIGNKAGYINKNDSLIFEIKDKSRYYQYNFSNGLVPNAQCDYLNTKGKITLDPKKLGFTPIIDYDGVCPSFSEGLLMVYYNNAKNIGFINQIGQLKIKTHLKWITGDIPPVTNFSNGFSAIQVNNKWGFIDKNGKNIVKPYFSEVSPFINDLAFVANEFEYGYIDKKGNFVWKTKKKSLLNE